MKKLLITGICMMLLTGCSSAPTTHSKTSSASPNTSQATRQSFKEQYESLNGKKNDDGKTMRTVTIPSDNPFVEITPEDVLKKTENGDSFYVYFGDPLCPWCRSVIETATEVAKAKNISEIYSVDVWDNKGNEKFRDTYDLVQNVPTKTAKGTDTYEQLLKRYGNVLEKYILTDSQGNTYETGEKRIYAPTYIYVKNGKAIRMTEGISKKQTDAYMDLSTEIINDETKQFQDFFSE